MTDSVHMVFRIMSAWREFANANPKIVRTRHGSILLMLMERCNRSMWSKDFPASTLELMNECGISDKHAFLDSINDLKDWGFLAVKNGTNRFEPSKYTIKVPKNPTKIAVGRHTAKSVAVGIHTATNNGVAVGGHTAKPKVAVGIHTATPADTYYSLNTLSTNTFVDSTESTPKKKSEGDSENSATTPKKPKKGKTTQNGQKEHDKKIYECFVSAWFTHYEKNTGDKPTFGARQGREIKKLITLIAAKAKARDQTLNENNMQPVADHFFTAAWKKDQWLQNNFLLHNLISQFDAITTPKQQQGNSGSPTRRNGAKPDTGELRAIVQRMHDVDI